MLKQVWPGITYPNKQNLFAKIFSPLGKMYINENTNV